MSEMYGFWFSLAGKQLQRIKPWELAEAKRLWAKHADIRTGNAQTENSEAKALQKPLRR